MADIDNDGDLDLLTANYNGGSGTVGWFHPQPSNDALLVGRGYTVSIGGSQLVDFQGTLIPLTLSRNSGSMAPSAG